MLEKFKYILLVILGLLLLSACIPAASADVLAAPQDRAAPEDVLVAPANQVGPGISGEQPVELPVAQPTASQPEGGPAATQSSESTEPGGALTVRPTRAAPGLQSLPTITSTLSAPPFQPYPFQGRRPKDGIPPKFERVLEGLVEAAKQDLARRLDIPVAQIELIAIESIELEGDLDCSPPKNCPQQAFPGHRPGLRILLQANGKIYVYHSDGLRRVVFQE